MVAVTTDIKSYYKRKEPSSSHIDTETPTINVTTNIPRSIPTSSIPKLVDLDHLPSDPAERIRILDYHPNQRDEIRRRYWLKGPCQPRGHDFPSKKVGNKDRRFNPSWFDKYGNWLYLCRDYIGNQGGNEAFVMKGFKSWNKTERFGKHVGGINSFHNRALKSCEDLVKQNQSIEVAFHKQDDKKKKENRIRLNATIEGVRFCLKSALAFRGHDETQTSLFKGNFLELMDLIISQNEELRNLSKAPGNNQLLSPCIQKDIATCFEKGVSCIQMILIA